MDEAVLSLDAAVDLTRTGDLWLFRGRSAADHAIRAVTNAPVNHVGMAVVLDDLPPLMWHAELSKGLLDVWTGTHHRGVQLHDLRAAVEQWSNRYDQRSWLRQLHTPVTPEMEDAVLRTIARMNGTPFPRRRRSPVAGSGEGCGNLPRWSRRTAPRWSPAPTRQWVCSTERARRTTTTRACSGPETILSCSTGLSSVRRSASASPGSQSRRRLPPQGVIAGSTGSPALAWDEATRDPGLCGRGDVGPRALSGDRARGLHLSHREIEGGRHAASASCSG